MSYQVGSISSLIFGGGAAASSADGAKKGEKVAAIAKEPAVSLFSESNKQLFARSVKAEEFPKMKIEKPVEEEVKKKKKPKKAKQDKDAPEAPKVPASNGVETEADSGKGAEKEDCTIFVGNVPITETIKSITKLFQEFGPVESVRLRSVPVAGAKVDDAGNQNLVKKVCVNDKKFGEQKGSFNVYVVFKNKEDADKSLGANNRLVGTRHIRVDHSTPSLFDTNRTVFLGGLPHYADEEELREYFANVLPNKQDDIEGIRIIRDPETLVGKGIGYLMLKDRDAVMKALSLHQETFKKRWVLRVTTCGKRTKRSPKPAGEVTTKETSEENTGEASGGDKKKERKSGAVFPDRDDKKRKRSHDNADFALKRIKLKSTMTKDKYLKSKHQKKAQPGRKGKRLGGVVKRAMKAQAASGKK